MKFGFLTRKRCKSSVCTDLLKVLIVALLSSKDKRRSRRSQESTQMFLSCFISRNSLIACWMCSRPPIFFLESPDFWRHVRLMAKYHLCEIFLNSVEKPGRAAVWKLLHKLILWSNFEVAARPGFSKEFKNILHRWYLTINLTCLQKSGDSKKIGED